MSRWLAILVISVLAVLAIGCGGNVSALEAELAAAEARIATLEAELEAAEARITTLEADLEAFIG